MHEVRALNVDSDQRDPVQAHVEVVRCRVWLVHIELVELKRDLFDTLEEAFNEDLSVLLLDDTAQMDVYEEVSTLRRYCLVLTLDSN